MPAPTKAGVESGFPSENATMQKCQSGFCSGLAETALEQAGIGDRALSETVMVRTSDVMEIKGSPVKLIGLFALGVLMTALSAALAFGWIPAGPIAEAVGWSGLVFFGLCTAICLWRLFTANQTIVTITPHGIMDIRVAADVVPWSAIRNVSTAEVQGQQFVVLAVDPSIEQQLALTLVAKWSRGPNRMLGVDGLCVSAVGLRINHDSLFRACSAQWRAATGAR
jgi:hypothetical protein